MTRAQSKIVGWLIMLGLPILLLVKFFEKVGFVVPLVLAVVGVVLIVWINQANRAKRLKELTEKYGDAEVAEKILNGYFWQGQTVEQLMDSLGSPVEIDEKTLKTKFRQVWKYNRLGVNRFGLRVTVENGYVAGWDKKA